MFKLSEKRVAEGKKAIPFKETPHRGGIFRPEGIVLHDTAGSLKRHSSVDWFLNSASKASAHFVVERDGEITQMAKLDEQCWHAGKSAYGNRPRVNEFAYGIEIVNMGKMERTKNNAFKPWFNSLFYQGDANLEFLHAETPEHGSGYWHGYSVEQIEAVTALCKLLRDEVGAKWITAHWFVSPGRKFDTNPLFPLHGLRRDVFGESTGGKKVMTIARVNQRRWPSYNDNVIQVIPKGQVVEAIRSGSFKKSGRVEEKWYLARFEDQEGWVNARYFQTA